MAVTDIANSNLTFTGVPVGVQVTRVTDSSADWASVGTSTYFYDKTDKLIHYKNSGGTVLELFSASGLTYFAEAQSTTAPNATVNVDSLTAVASTTNADVAIVPKGSGSFMLGIPDNTTTGGNKRGANSVDLQTSRTNAGHVASGSYSTILGGANNQATNEASIAAGVNSVASGYRSVALQNSQATNDYSFSAGVRTEATGSCSVAMGGAGYTDTRASGANSVSIGTGTQASGSFSCAIGGYLNTASGYASFATGFAVSTQGVQGRHSSGHMDNITADCQKSTFFLGKTTTNATPTTLWTRGSQGSPSATNQVILSNNSAYRFKGTIIGKQSASTNVCAWDVDGLIVRGANAAATTLVVGNVNLVSNTPAWGTPTLAADTTNGGLRVQVTGLAATNIQWTAVIETTEVIYA